MNLNADLSCYLYDYMTFPFTLYFSTPDLKPGIEKEEDFYWWH